MLQSKDYYSTNEKVSRPQDAFAYLGNSTLTNASEITMGDVGIGVAGHRVRAQQDDQIPKGYI